MPLYKSNVPSVIKVYSITGRSLKKNLILFVPFVIFAVFEFIALTLVYLAPRAPLKTIFGPFITTFWGEKFLRYPVNFFLLPKLAALSRMVLSVVFGSLLTGVAVAVVLDVYNKKQIRLGSCFKSAFKQYINLFAIVFSFTALFYFLIQILTTGLFRYFIAGHNRLLFLGISAWMGPVLLIINFVLALLIQSAFIYAIPILIIEKEKLVRSIVKSFVLFKRLFIKTLILVGLPMLIYVPIVVLLYNTAFLVDEVFPESVLLVLILGVILNSLIIDPIVTIAATFLYLMNKEN